MVIEKTSSVPVFVIERHRFSGLQSPDDSFGLRIALLYPAVRFERIAKALEGFIRIAKRLARGGSLCLNDEAKSIIDGDYIVFVLRARLLVCPRVNCGVGA